MTGARKPRVYKGPEGPFGCHVSMAGGFSKAPQRARDLGGGTFQIFCKSPRSWSIRFPDEAEALAFREQATKLSMKSPVAHAGYLANLASPDNALVTRSIKTVASEIEIAAQLGIGLFVMHPGSFVTGDPAKGMKRLLRSLDKLESATLRFAVKVLFETTAGQGSGLGHNLEQLSEMVMSRRDPQRYGVCLDTAHLFAAGYDLRDPERLGSLLQEMEQRCYPGCVGAAHINDSKSAMGSRVDRHERLGRGMLGAEPIGRLLREPKLFDIPKILEVPGGDKAFTQDLAKMARLVACPEPVEGLEARSE